MRLIDADALREQVFEVIPEPWLEYAREQVAEAIEAAPTVCCEECKHKGTYPAPCGICTPSNLRFERRTP